MILEARDLYCGYGADEIVHGIDLDVAPGSIVAILGPNGSGKSTFLKAVLGYLRITRGSVRFDGRDIVGLGATTCKNFVSDVEQNARVQRDYFAWAQGFMSGVLMRAPPGVDEGLELNPPAFPLLRQIEFLRSFCARNPDKDYSDGVIELYRALRIEKSF
jgi:ABC-type dipeptide/oligopeptide/nickel transport system ATPase component